jgi:hypothetical protein
MLFVQHDLMTSIRLLEEIRKGYSNQDEKVLIHGNL